MDGWSSWVCLYKLANFTLKESGDRQKKNSDLVPKLVTYVRMLYPATPLPHTITLTHSLLHTPPCTPNLAT